MLRSRLSFLYSMYVSGRSFRNRHVGLSDAASAEEVDFVRRTYTGIGLMKELFDLGGIANTSGVLLKRLVTLGMYVSELDRRLPGKVVEIR